MSNDPICQPIVGSVDGQLPSSVKFNIGDRVSWFRVLTQDFGVVSDRFYGLEGSVQADGWHHFARLDSQSLSFAHCKKDYGFEDDLALIIVITH
ncbi:hypothetical protein H6G00_04835 [Leptolyngbya sp. FACHB-541]|uniref:hypothetical protein n=1 Tax=Leptolyngbya sp. FACHB-541 TaxID=2692810 RepID=UPI0016831F7B|nr:hypothetical protein [Leptolyngbya sp. FACHB-541]MBD1870379.1 hypothetical protein [Cyanobacteria bacterium FACHB-471]MBD1995943.1 hypothetical protein [Leptolyngbya sp. FACHB-541]